MLERFLTKSAGGGRVFYCRTLLSLGLASPSAVDSGSGYSALHVASASGHARIVEILLNRGADVAVLDRSGCTALHRSVYLGHSHVTDLLLEREGLPLDAKSISGLSALHVACLRGNVPAIEKLISKGASLTLPDKDGRTPFHYAAMRFGEDVLSLFVQRRININDVDTSGMSALHSAIAGGNVAGLRYLLSLRGIDTSLRIAQNTTVSDIFIPRGINLLTQITLLEREGVLEVDTTHELREVLKPCSLEEDDLRAIAAAQTRDIFSQSSSTSSVFATERVMRFAAETPQKRHFHDHFVNIFRNQMQLWHLVHAGLIPIQDKTAQAEGVLSALINSCPVPGLSALMSAVSTAHQAHRLSDWDRIASQRFLMLSDPLTSSRRLGAMILNIYAPIIDMMSVKKVKTPSDRPIIQSIMKVIPKPKLSDAERFAVELNALLIDHIAAKRLLDDISLPKQLFALVAISMNDLLDDFVDIARGSPEKELIDSLSRGFRGTLTSGDAMRKAYNNLSRKHAQLSEFSESRAGSMASLPMLDARPASHVDRVRASALQGERAVSGELPLPSTPMGVSTGMLVP